MSSEGRILLFLPVCKLAMGLRSDGASARERQLSAWSSAAEADLYRDGLIVTRRLDLLIGLDPRSGRGAAYTWCLHCVYTALAQAVIRVLRGLWTLHMCCNLHVSELTRGPWDKLSVFGMPGQEV